MASFNDQSDNNGEFQRYNYANHVHGGEVEQLTDEEIYGQFYDLLVYTDL